MKSGIIYCRVSTTEQAEKGMSLLSQERVCRDFAEKEGIQIDRVFIERGESAKTTDRPELQKMLKYCALNVGRVDSLLIYRIDRLSRDTQDYGRLRLFFKSQKIELVSMSESFDDTATGKLMERIFADFAQYDNDVRAERTVAGMTEALRQGRYIFNAPFGFEDIGERRTANIRPIPELAAKINKVFIEVTKGHKSQEEVRQYAKSIGLVRNDGNPLAKSHFYKMLRNPVYKGFIEVPSMGIQQKGNFDPIVQSEIFDAVQSILDGKSKKLPIYKKIHPDFPLRGTVKCVCGRPMTSNWSKGKGGRYGYYRCSECERVNIRKEEIEKRFTDFLQSIELKDDVKDLVKVAVNLNWESRAKEHNEKISSLEKQKKAIKAKQDMIIEKNLEGVYSNEVAKRRISELDIELGGVNVELMRYQKPDGAEDELIAFSVTFLSNMTTTWSKMDAYQQNKFQKFIFPDGLIYENGNYRTQEKPFTVSLNEALNVENSIMVTPRRIELRLPD